MTLDVQTHSVKEALEVKDSIDPFLKLEIYPEIEKILDEINALYPGKYIRFDSIPLHVNLSSNASLNRCKKLLINELNKNINNLLETVKDQDLAPSTPEDRASEAMLFYFEEGRKPWWFSEVKIVDDEQLKTLLKSPAFLDALRLKLKKKHALKRVIFQLNDEQLIEMLSAILTIKTNLQPSEIIVSERIRLPFWEALFVYSENLNWEVCAKKVKQICSHLLRGLNNEKNIGSHSNVAQILPLINLLNGFGQQSLILNQTDNGILNFEINHLMTSHQAGEHNNKMLMQIEKQDVPFKPSMEEYIKTVDDTLDNSLLDTYEDGLLIQNAGLVLLHPFLPAFFKEVGFISEEKKEGKSTIKPTKIDQAIHLLHYIATKNENANEYDLILEKFLCGIPIKYPISSKVKLTKAQKKEAESLLASVLTHWTALRSNNTDALRSTFLMREGKLILEKEREKIYVQRKTEDILLEKLPWNMSLIKFPWKENFIFLEW